MTRFLPRPRNPWFRAARILKYGFFSLAAVITYWYPTTVVFGAFESIPALAYIWSTMLLTASLCCLSGVVMRKWTGEYIGLPGVICCLFLYAVGSFANALAGLEGMPFRWSLFNALVNEPPNPPLRIFLTLMFLGFTFSSIARRQDVGLQKSLAEYERRRLAGKRGL